MSYLTQFLEDLLSTKLPTSDYNVTDISAALHELATNPVYDRDRVMLKSSAILKYCAQAMVASGIDPDYVRQGRWIWGMDESSSPTLIFVGSRGVA